MRLRDFMQAPVYGCSPTTSLSAAAHEMEAHNVGSLIVRDDQGQVVGILTDRDVTLAIGRGHQADSAVSDAMSHQVQTIPESATLDDAAAKMDSHAIRRLPVLSHDGEAIGIVCLDDLYGYLTQEAITLAGAARAQGTPHA